MSNLENTTMNHLVPDMDIVNAFGFDENPILLEGGQGESYLVGSIVLKPITDVEAIVWSADLMSSIVESGFRVARPIKTKDGLWIYRGWHAFSFVQGKEVKGRAVEKIQVSRIFHKALVNYEKPSFLAEKQDPWAIADRMVWGEQSLEYGSRLEAVLSQLQLMLKPISLNSQLIHGDMTGNVLFQEGSVPAVIDMSPYWRPAEFATAIIIVDSVVWEGGEDSLIDQIKDESDMNQLLVRAAMWRIKTTEECIKQFGRGSIDDVDSYTYFIDLLKKRNL